jgi:hypothetical protein
MGENDEPELGQSELRRELEAERHSRERNRRQTKGVIWLASICGAVLVCWQFGERVYDKLVVHLDGIFVSEAQAQTLQRDVKEAVDKATSAAEIATEAAQDLQRYIARQTLEEARRTLRSDRDQLADLELRESQDGANSLSRSMKAALRLRIESGEERVRCLEDPERAGC